MPCGWCKKPIYRRKGQFKSMAFCNRSCKAKYAWSKPGQKEKVGHLISQNEYHSSPAKKKQLDAARVRCKYGKEMRDKIRQSRMKQHFPTKMTSIEKSLHDAFTRMGLVFVMHKSFFGRWQPDFVFEDQKVIVQADGDYWHSKPEQIEKDEAFNSAASNHGWTVLRFKGSEIKSNIELCVSKTILAIKKNQAEAV